MQRDLRVGLDESDCLATATCHAEYANGRYGLAATNQFVACWDTLPGVQSTGTCAGLDGWTCANHDNCASVMTVTSGSTAFDQCIDETAGCGTTCATGLALRCLPGALPTCGSPLRVPADVCPRYDLRQHDLRSRLDLRDNLRSERLHAELRRDESRSRRVQWNDHVRQRATRVSFGNHHGHRERLLQRLLHPECRLHAAGSGPVLRDRGVSARAAAVPDRDHGRRLRAVLERLLHPARGLRNPRMRDARDRVRVYRARRLLADLQRRQLHLRFQWLHVPDADVRELRHGRERHVKPTTGRRRRAGATL